MCKCCGASLVWVRIIETNHRTQFCPKWIAEYHASGQPMFFIVEV